MKKARTLDIIRVTGLYWMLLESFLVEMATIEMLSNLLNLKSFILLQNTVTVPVTVTKTAKNVAQKKL